MKAFLVVFVVVVASTVVGWLGQREAPKIPFVTPRTADIGSVEQLSTTECSFEVHNPLAESVVITNVETTCSCAVPNLEVPLTLPAGASKTISLDFEARRASGSKSSAVTLVIQKRRSNAGDPLQQMVVRHLVRAFVKPEIWTADFPVEMGEMRTGKMYHRKVHLRSGSDEYRVVSISSNRDFVKVEEYSPSFENGKCIIPIKINLLDRATDGRLDATLRVKLQGGLIEDVDVPLSGSIQSEVSVRPHVLTFSGTKAEESVRLTVSPKAPFEIASISPSSQAFEVTFFSKLNRSSIYRVKWTADEDQERECELKVILKDPGSGATLIRTVPVFVLSNE